jgi:hypothetical protein
VKPSSTSSSNSKSVSLVDDVSRILGRCCDCSSDVHLWCEYSCGATALVMRVLLWCECSCGASALVVRVLLWCDCSCGASALVTFICVYLCHLRTQISRSSICKFTHSS